MSLLDKLIIGVSGARILEDFEQFQDKKAQEREQHRLDSLFWQNAASRGSAAYEDDDEDIW